jgi:hypothetical protein
MRRNVTVVGNASLLAQRAPYNLSMGKPESYQKSFVMVWAFV